MTTIRQAITTKYLCPTNTRGARIKASCQSGSRIGSWDDALSADENHVAACAALCATIDASNAKKYPGSANTWSQPKIAGCTASGLYVHVFAE
jgi:hypothetical protein